MVGPGDLPSWGWEKSILRKAEQHVKINFYLAKLGVLASLTYQSTRSRRPLCKISSQLLSLRAPVNKQAGKHQEKRAASYLGLVHPNIGSARRRNQGHDHGKERDGKTAESDDYRPFRPARNEQAFAARLFASPT